MAVVLAVVGLGVPMAAAVPVAADRVAGEDRYETAAEVAAAAYPDGAATVFVATGRNFPDAVAAAPAAHRAGAPLLLVAPTAVPAPSAEALDRLQPSRVVLLGGEQAISAPVAEHIGEIAPEAAVERIAGPNRYATAAAVALDGNADPDVVFVASGEAFPDSLSAGPAAAAEDGVILLTASSHVPDETVETIRRLAPSEIVVLGGTSAISAEVQARLESLGPEVTRLSGADRYATAAAVAERMGVESPSRTLIVRGDEFADGLAAGPYAAALDVLILLAAPVCTPEPTLAAVDRLAPQALTLVGGPAALDDHVSDLIPCPQVLAQGLGIPWGLTFDDAGRAYVGERDTGRILRIERPGDAPVEVERVAVDAGGSGGLLGLTAAGAAPGVLYAYITTEEDNRVVRVTIGGSVEPVLTGIPRGSGHFGGGLALGDDGLLYVATGDGRRADAPRAAQDPDDLAGKILRITTDGEVPADNPVPGSVVYALGFRNPQALTWNDQGWLLATDFGPERDDELNRVVPGGNYGWPDVTGTSEDPDYLDPLVVRQPAEASWSGLAVLQSGGIPAWDGSLIAGSLRGERLWRFDVDADGALVESESLYVGEYGRIRTVVEAPDGAVWFTTSNRDNRGDPPRPVDDRVIRVGPPAVDEID